MEDFENFATIRKDYITVFPVGNGILEVECCSAVEFKNLPQVVTYENVLYGKTGWSSDWNRAYFKTNAAIANVSQQN